MFEIYNLFKYIVNDFEKLNNVLRKCCFAQAFCSIFSWAGQLSKLGERRNPTKYGKIQNGEFWLFWFLAYLHKRTPLWDI